MHANIAQDDTQAVSPEYRGEMLTFKEWQSYLQWLKDQKQMSVVVA